MNLMRKAAVASSSTILLTLAGAMTGIGSSAAQAYEVSASPEVVVVNLTADEATTVAANSYEDSSLCALVEGRAQQASLVNPMGQFTCERALYECSQYAAGRPVTVVFYWFSIECRF